MPLIALAYLAFAAGLLLGYSNAGFPWTALLAACALAALAGLHSGRNRSTLALGILFLGALLLSSQEEAGTPFSRKAGTAREAGLLPQARQRASRSIEAIFREDAPLAKALLIAERQDIPLEVNDAFVGAGLVHILSISGLHVGIIAASIALLLESARLSRRLSALVTLGTIALYVAILGGQPPALRAAAMVGAITLGKISQRPTSPWALLATGAFIPLLQPRIVMNLGYQLSVAGMAALIAGGVITKKFLKPRYEGWRLKLYGELSSSILATVVTAPLIAWAFGRLSLVGPVSNVVATPVVALLQPLLFLALLLSPFPPIARFAADAAHPLLEALDFCARFFAGVPGAVVQVTPAWPGVVLGIAAVCALLVAIVSRFPARPLIVSASCCAAGLVVPFPAIHSGKLEMHMLDVGQGDAILLRTPGGSWVLVDAGRAWKGGDAGRSVVIPYVKTRGGDVAAFILSHPHLDHVGGAGTVLRSLRPGVYWDAAFAGGSDAYRQSLVTAADEMVVWRRARPGNRIIVDGVALEFLAPDSAWTVGLRDANEASTVVSVQYGMVRFLLTGDAEHGEEKWLLEHAPLRADVLKVGHHGSSTSSGDEFIRRVCPLVALISVGAINSYGHPSGDVIAAFRRIGARVLRTDQEGTVVVRTDGKRIDVHTSERNWAFSAGLTGSPSEVRSSCRDRSSRATHSSREPAFAWADSRR